jgi:hypothetical protein
MTMPATRSLVITVMGAAALWACGDHRIVSVNGNHRG